MRASDLVQRRVLDAAGAHIGVVVDVKLVAGKQDAAAPALSYALAGLVVARRDRGSLLGYGHGRMAGPWPLSAIADRAYRRLLWVPWSAVGSLGDGNVRLATSSPLPTLVSVQQD